MPRSAIPHTATTDKKRHELRMRAIPFALQNLGMPELENILKLLNILNTESKTDGRAPTASSDPTQNLSATILQVASGTDSDLSWASRTIKDRRRRLGKDHVKLLKFTGKLTAELHFRHISYAEQSLKITVHRLNKARVLVRRFITEHPSLQRAAEQLFKAMWITDCAGFCEGNEQIPNFIANDLDTVWKICSEEDTSNTDIAEQVKTLWLADSADLNETQLRLAVTLTKFLGLNQDMALNQVRRVKAPCSILNSLGEHQVTYLPGALAAIGISGERDLAQNVFILELMLELIIAEVKRGNKHINLSNINYNPLVNQFISQLAKQAIPFQDFTKEQDRSNCCGLLRRSHPPTTTTPAGKLAKSLFYRDSKGRMDLYQTLLKINDPKAIYLLMLLAPNSPPRNSVPTL